MKRLFIGSASQSLVHANTVADFIKDDVRQKAIVWTDVFTPGLQTFEAIEKIAREVSGAIFIASPDDLYKDGDKEFFAPRANVLIELGYFAAILGKTNTALLVFPGVAIPSDLRDLTHVKVSESDITDGISLYKSRAGESLRRWIDSLPSQATKIPIAEVFHGYTGKWDISVDFGRWRSRDILPAESVHFDGKMSVNLKRDTGVGEGCLTGDVYARILNNGDLHDVAYSVTDLITNLRADKNGSISFTSEFHNRQCTSSPEEYIGTPSQIKRFEWNLNPIKGTDYEFEGTYKARATAALTSTGKVRAQFIPN